MLTTSHTVHSEAQTAQIAANLATSLKAGDVVLLDGSLAAGKTFFTRALVGALESEEDVTSPTYTIANIYETAKAPVLHVDAYRLKGANEFYHLGLDDYFDTGICIIEWGSRIEGFFENPLSIHIGFPDEMPDGAHADARIITISASAARWAPVITALQDLTYD
jgi:tRNA threonylcarbamoyladenosine biosynthesis protein TsaE